jgi:hypothetical protein
MALPPTSSVATLAAPRATVVQTPTANPIVAALPRVAVARHYRLIRLRSSSDVLDNPVPTTGATRLSSARRYLVEKLFEQATQLKRRPLAAVR